VCLCFYGWEGADCSQPISDPPCVNGFPIAPNVCRCDLGWTGIICDVPHCPQGCGFGYCVDGQVCECYQGYYSSHLKDSECDVLDCKTFHPQCIKCNLTHCLECNSHFVLNSKMNECNACKELYEPLCLTCDEIECKECYWPYKYNRTLKKCFTMGLLEFSVPTIRVVESNYSYFAIVRRTFEL
jgi:hypothetical protein